MGTAASALDKVIDAYSKSQESMLKLKMELVKNKMREKSLMENFKMRQQLSQQMAQAKERAKFQTPEQQYLSRRAMEENPIARLVAPQEGDTSGGGQVEFPAEMPPIKNNQGLYNQPKPPTEDQKNMMFLSTIEKMKQAGNNVPQWALNVSEKMKIRMRERLGYKDQKEETGRKSTEWKSYIDMLQKKSELEDLSTSEQQKLDYARKKYDALMFGDEYTENNPNYSGKFGGSQPPEQSTSESNVITNSKYQIGQIIPAANGKKYQIIGLTDPNDPDIEEYIEKQ